MKSKRTIEMMQFIKATFSMFKGEKDYYCELNSDVGCGTGGKKICDLAGYEYMDGLRHNSIGIKVKQCVSDFKSGCSDSYTFDVNYLCVPSELVGYALRYMEENGPNRVGIIEYCDSTQYNSPRLALVRSPLFNNSKYDGERADCIMEYQHVPAYTLGTSFSAGCLIYQT